MDLVAFELDLPLLGHLVVGWYGVFTVLGLNAALLLALYDLPRLGLVTRSQVWDMVVAGGIAALLGGHLLYQLTPGPRLVWRSGMVLYGAILGGAAGVAVAAKWMNKPVWRVLDASAPAGVLPPLFGRIGCLMAGCCFGAPCDLPWAITFTDPRSPAPRGIPLHPTQLYSVAALVLLFFLLRWRGRRSKFQGELAMLYLGYYSAARFIIEFFRGDSIRGLLLDGALSFSQVVAIPCLLAAGAGYWWLRRRAHASGRG